MRFQEWPREIQEQCGGEILFYSQLMRTMTAEQKTPLHLEIEALLDDADQAVRNQETEAWLLQEPQLWAHIKSILRAIANPQIVPKEQPQLVTQPELDLQPELEKAS
jgi:hypothetical protein